MVIKQEPLKSLVVYLVLYFLSFAHVLLSLDTPDLPMT